MKIRLAKSGDGQAIAKVHVESWKTTYRGLIEDSYLETLSYEEREKMWEAAIERGFEDSCLYVAEVAGKIVGFASAGAERTNKFQVDAELYAIYILQEYQKNGTGKKLCQNVVRFLQDNDYQSMLVWVLINNPSRNFYLSLHPEEAGEEQIQIGGIFYKEVAYVWKNLNEFLRFLEK